METKKLTELITELKKERNAIALVHNYQPPELYEIADHIGDSLELARAAARTDADVILFCGVKFMAETAKILNPKKTVLLPSLAAGCSLADTATAEKLEEFKKKYPDAAVVSYVNTYADVKALSDVCCTSANATQIVNALPHKRIIFLPDKNLGRYVQAHTDKEIILWDGYCFVHEKLDARMLAALKEENPDAEIIAHPESNQQVLAQADHICGTGGMAGYAQKSTAQKFIIVTECGMAQRLRMDVPGKQFMGFCNLCHFMKANTLTLAARALIRNEYKIELDAKIMARAKRALDRMMELTTHEPITTPVACV